MVCVQIQVVHLVKIKLASAYPTACDEISFTNQEAATNYLNFGRRILCLNRDHFL